MISPGLAVNAAVSKLLLKNPSNPTERTSAIFRPWVLRKLTCQQAKILRSIPFLLLILKKKNFFSIFHLALRILKGAEPLLCWDEGRLFVCFIKINYTTPCYIYRVVKRCWYFQKPGGLHIKPKLV